MPVATHDTRTLTGASLVLTQSSLPAGWIAFVALAVASLCVAIGGIQLVRGQQHLVEQDSLAMQQKTRQLQADLDKAQLLQQVSAARSQELERQIEALHRTLREGEEELAFLRRPRDGRRQP
jgi:uncharacterized protein HemX